MNRAPSDPRRPSLLRWLSGHARAQQINLDSLRPASDDASFRRYFRVDCEGGPETSLIVMDAPPDKENCAPFVHAAEVMRRAGLSVPRILERDLDQGFLLLEDFGDRTYLSALSEDTAHSLYGAAAGALIKLQQASRPGTFPDYDRALMHRELDLYPTWYVAHHKRCVLTDRQRATLAEAFDRIVTHCLAQPRVDVHRDWHCRNLMVIEASRLPGILDFQDAVHGPITYDLVSILRDAYIDWPEDRQIDWAIRYWQAARAAELPVGEDFGEFYKAFEWMGLQRHLKVLGIFARLAHRDGKTRYLADLPRVLGYTLATVRRYRDLSGLQRILESVEEVSQSSGYSF
jgi:aminoglycoside/choline kinase family phosphotransferase